MAIISIVGTSGVGKSYLVKQLASLHHAPAFFEGEEGTIPTQILESIFDGSHPLARWKYFLDRYMQNLKKAAAISNKLGIDCYVDGAMFSARAILVFEEEKHKPRLISLFKKYELFKSDIVILLVADKKGLMKKMQIRSRSSETNNRAVERSLKIQNAFISLAKQEKNVITVDRTGLDFSKSADLKKVATMLRKFVGQKGWALSSETTKKGPFRTRFDV